MRERAAGTIQHIATKELGARDMIQHSGIPALVTCLEDEETKVRDAAYLALLEAARFNSVRSELVSLKTALPRLMSLVLKEEGWRSLQGLHILNEVVQVRTNQLKRINLAWKDKRCRAQRPGQGPTTPLIGCINRSGWNGWHSCDCSACLANAQTLVCARPLLQMNGSCLQVRNNAEALKQLVDTASAIPSLGQLISAEQSQDIQEQAAQLLGLATSNFDDAKLEAVQVRRCSCWKFGKNVLETWVLVGTTTNLPH